ncbi:MAG: PIG-L deacetylase family protein [Dehalococcoidia bacterium]
MLEPLGKYETAMVVTAHPDDAEFGCSGTVARWISEGTQVVYVLVTDGSKGTEDRSISPEQLADIRKKEQIEAGKILGLKDVAFLDYPDGYLEPTLDVRKDISKQIRIHKPQILITTNPNRTLTGENYIGHPDHFAAGEAALSAVYPSARDHLTFPELDKEGLEPHKVREVLIIGHDNPNIWFDITDSIDTAEKGLLAHKSQLGQEAADRTRERKREIGQLYGVQYAEHFKGFVIR